MSRREEGSRVSSKEPGVEGRRVARNSLWMILAPLFLNLLSILIAGYMTRSLGEVRFGEFALAFAYAEMLSYLTSMGLSSVTIRDISRDRSVAAANVARVSVFRLSLALLLMALLMSLGLLGARSSEARFAMLLAAATIPLRAYLRTLVDAFSGFEEQWQSARCEMAGGLVLTFSSALALALGWGIRGLCFAYLSGPIVSLLLLHRALSRQHFVPQLALDREFCKQKLREGLPFFGIGLLTTFINRVDVFLLDTLYGPAVVGIYLAVTYQVVHRLRVIPNALCGVVFPILNRLSPDARAGALGRCLRYTLAATVPMAVGAALLGDNLVVLLFGDAFQSGGPILAVAAFGLPLWGMIQLSGVALTSFGKERESLKKRALTAVIFTLLSIILVPRLAGLGSALAFVSALILEAIFLFVALRSYVPGLFSALCLPRLLAANAVMAAFVLAASSLSSLTRVAVGVLSYGAAALATRLIPLSELSALRAGARD